MRRPAGVEVHSALYVGSVMHHRLRPARHRLRYRLFTLLLDLDEMEGLGQRLRWFSVDRFNLFSLRRRDHGDGAAEGPRGFVEAQLRAAGLPAGGAIRLFTMPRLLGYAFNPLSVYFCHHPDGRLQALLYEVNNTFGERHHYLIPVSPAQAEGGKTIAQRCDKRFHVSPFLPMALEYRFRLQPPQAADGSPLAVGVNVHDAEGLLLMTRHDARRRPLTDAALLRAWLSHPLLTVKVVAAIHWEALRLWRKRVPFFRKPAPPDRPVTTTITTTSAAP